METQSIATTILAHFGGRTALALIGAQALADERSLTVVYKAKAENKADRVKIELTPDDLYRVTFYKFNRRALNCPVVGEPAKVFSADLMDHFERATGLFLSMKPRG